ncbi:hypothetical protein D6C97_03328 [Aureobasidium pullulans]|nr:hypothetical protein D6C97_03328 [Aureobasidium pullulans]
MSPTTIYTGPDPDTTTRAEFTTHHLNRQCPTVCSPRFSHIFRVHQTLIRLMDAHPAMDQNRDQTYNTPAASKNKVYFMWDFLARTSGTLVNVPPRNPSCSNKYWKDVVLRCVLAKELILDHTGKLEQMNRATGYNDDAGIEFGEEIEAEAAKLDEEFNAEEREMIEWLRGKIPSGRIMDGLGG